MFIKATICDRCDQPIMNDRHTATVSWKGGIEDSTYHDGCFNAMIEADIKYNRIGAHSEEHNTSAVLHCRGHDDYAIHEVNYRHYPKVSETIRTTNCQQCGFIEDSTEWKS